MRVNDLDTPWFAADVAALPHGVDGVIVPKIESLEGLAMVGQTLTASGRDHLPVLAGIETALGIADARPLLAHPLVAAAYFGAEDFIADMGGVRTPSNAEVAHARGAVALAGRLAEVPVLDQVVADFRDDDRFAREADEARAMGYAGKLCIHPGQVGTANRAWTPSADEVDRGPTPPRRLRRSVGRRRGGHRLRGAHGRRTGRGSSASSARPGRARLTVRHRGRRPLSALTGGGASARRVGPDTRARRLAGTPGART